MVLWLEGETVMAVTLAGTTVSVVEPAMVELLVEVAVIVVVPTPTAVASPELLMLATVVELLLDQVTGVLPVLESLKVPTAVNCLVEGLLVVPVVMVGVAGPTAIDVSVGSVKNPLQLTPKAMTTNTAKASVNDSLRPINITNRLRYVILADRPAVPGSPLVHAWSRTHTTDILPHHVHPRNAEDGRNLQEIFARLTASLAIPRGGCGLRNVGTVPKDD